MADQVEEDMMMKMCITPDVIMPRLISFLSSLLQRVAESNDHQKTSISNTSVFNGLTRPTISIQTYLERIFKYANCSPSCYIIAYVYLDRFTQRQPSLPISPFNVHRLLITSVMLSAKFMDDIYYNNAYYAKVGGITTVEINFLEVDFLFGLGFHLNVTPSTFRTYCAYLQREMIIAQPPPHELITCIVGNENNSEDDRTSKIKSSSSLHHQQQQQQQLAV